MLILIHSEIFKHVICFLVTLTQCLLFSSHSCLLLQKRKLDAVYYYMRSLAASNPILTAKESLMSLFEEAKRKVHNKFTTLLFLFCPTQRVVKLLYGACFCLGLFFSEINNV